MQNARQRKTENENELLAEAQRGASKAKRKAGELATEMKSSVASAAADLRDDAVKTVRDGATDAAEVGRNQTKQVVRSLGRALEAGGRSLEDDGMNGTAGYVRAAGRGLENAANEIGGLDPDRIGQKLETFVRDRPMMTFGALAMLGFAVAATFTTRKSDSSSRS